jgi:predicted GTPase
MADIVVISKVKTAKPEKVEEVMSNVLRINPDAKIIKAAIKITAEDDEAVKGKNVLVVEDGPTVTHGGMGYGAATIKAQELDAEIVDPRPYAKGSLSEIYDTYPHLGKVLPAVGYSEKQMQELSQVINATPCDIVLLGTPTDIRRYLNVEKPVIRVRYELETLSGEFEELILSIVKSLLDK